MQDPTDAPARSATPGEAREPILSILSSSRAVIGHGPGLAVPSGPVETLGRRVRAFLHDHPSAPLVAGALPFDREAADRLTAPARLGQDLAGPPADRPAGPRDWVLREEPPAADYAAAVSRALDRMAGERDAPTLRKVVLARSLLATSDAPIDAPALLHRLRATDASVTAFLVPLPPGPDGTTRHLVGATPELLVSRNGRSVVSHPLAGSARRGADPAADEAARASLTASDKDRREHALVTEFILDTLAPHCRALPAPDGTAIRSTRSMWHLGTRIEGELRDPDLSAADLAAMLHPTPAVCGLPREAAAALIPGLEAMDRGFYAGAVGWCDRAGDGAWHVSIRCAEVGGCRARLYAGAGIVPGSEPEAELRETEAKFCAMLHAIGVDTAGLPRA